MSSFKDRLIEACIESEECPMSGRNKRGGQQKWLAEKVGVSEQAASKWFNGKAVPWNQLPKIAEVLGVSLCWLSWGEEASNENEELTHQKVQEVSTRTQAIYAWCGKACQLGLNWSPVYNREHTDAVIITKRDAYDVRVEVMTAMKSRDTAGLYVEGMNVPYMDYDSTGKNKFPRDGLFRAKIPPENFSGWVTGVIAYELPRGLEYQFTSFHSDDIRERQIFIESVGPCYVVEIHRNERTLLSPIESNLAIFKEEKARPWRSGNLIYPNAESMQR